MLTLRVLVTPSERPNWNQRPPSWRLACLSMHASTDSDNNVALIQCNVVWVWLAGILAHQQGLHDSLWHASNAL